MTRDPLAQATRRPTRAQLRAAECIRALIAQAKATTSVGELATDADLAAAYAAQDAGGAPAAAGGKGAAAAMA